MADIRVRVGQPDLHVNVGQQDAIKVLASNTAVTSGIATFAFAADFANSVIGGIASVTSLNVSGVSTFAGNVYFTGNIIGNLTTIDGGRY